MTGTHYRSVILLPILITFLVILIPCNRLVAEDGKIEVIIPEYDFGDNAISIKLGMNIPMFWVSLSQINGKSVHATNLGLGGIVSVAWNAYINDSYTVGVDLGLALSSDINGSLLFMEPILAKGSYIITTPEMEIPISIGIGAIIMQLGDKTGFAFTLRPGITAVWRITSEWSMGATGEYWFSWAPPWVIASPSHPHMLGNFFELSATAIYHF